MSSPIMEVLSRLANPPAELVGTFTRKERDFFFDYARFVLRLVDSHEVRQKLRQLQQIENIHFGKSIDLRVMVFPARPLRGRPRNLLHGSYNQDSSQISLYPLKLPKIWIRKEGYSMFKTPLRNLSSLQRQTLREVCVSALSTLIHEVLHVKFEARGFSRYVEEAIVRKLEKKYAEEWFETLPDMTNYMSPIPIQNEA